MADQDIVIDAKRDLSIVSAEDSVDSESASSSKKSGSIGTRFQAAVGTVKTTNDGTAESVTQVGSQIASLGGDVTLKAGGQYTQTSSEVRTPTGDVSITAKDVLINVAMNTSDNSDHTTYGKTAIGGTISVPIVDALKSAAKMVSAGQKTSDGRMQTLAAVTAGYSSFEAYQQAQALNKIYNQSGLGAGIMNAGIRISISLGNSKSDNKVVTTSETAVGSTIAAGGNVSIRATGAGENSNLTTIGSDITAGNNVMLSADNDVNLLASKSTASQHSTNNSSGASIGIGFGIGGTSNGFTIDLAVSQARGKADGDDIGHTNSHVKAGNNVIVVSGGDTNLKGGVIAADSVVANIGGDLNIESLQDSSKFDSKQSSSGLNASLCIPPFCYGASTVGGSISKSKVTGEFLSVLEQSGIKTGDGGFQLEVAGNTDLKGGLISSSQTAVDQGGNLLITGSLSSSDLQNKDEHSASGFSLSGSVSGQLRDQSAYNQSLRDKGYTEEQMKAVQGQPTASGGFGSTSGSQSSTTRSGISGGLIAITDKAKQLAGGNDAAAVLASIDQIVTTESAQANAGSLTKAWDGQQLQKEVDAQVAITQEFSKQAPKAIAVFADKQLKTLNERAALTDDVATKDSILAEAKKWEEGGIYRVALHTVSGGLTGGIGGAFGAGAVAEGAQLLDKMQDGFAAALQELGLSGESAKVVAQGIAEATSVAVGAVVGGAGGAAAGLATDTNNRQLTSQEQKLLQKKAKDIAASLARSPDDVVKFEAYWYSMLTLAANARTDAQSAEKLNDYVETLALAAQQSGNLQDAQNFVLNLTKADAYIGQMVGQSIADRTGQAIVADGAVVKNFQSTPLQYLDHNLFGAGVLGAMGTAEAFGNNKDKLTNIDWYSTGAANENVLALNNISQLEKSLLTRTQTPNGSLEVICPECNLIGLNFGSTLKSILTYGDTIAIDASVVVVKDTAGNVIPTGIPRVHVGIELDSRLPQPTSGLDYSPKMIKAGTENNVWSHWVGYQSELRLANEIVKMPDQAVVSFGDKIGLPGADVLSVDTRTGDVIMWDSKYRSNPTNIGESPTFAVNSNRQAAVAKALEDLENSNLPREIKIKAMQNLEGGNFSTNTVGSGKVKNSVVAKYCNGKKC